MNEFWRYITTWYYSNPRRWVWVGIMLLVIVGLGLTGNLR